LEPWKYRKLLHQGKNEKNGIAEAIPFLSCPTMFSYREAPFGVLCSIIIAELIGVVIYTAAPVLIAAFNSEPDVVHYGVMQSRTIALFYFLLAFSHCIAAVLRGSGNASVPMIVMLCVWCLFRVSYITVTVHFIPDIRVIFWAYPLTWSISSVIFLALFLRGKWVYGFEKRK
jgi:Na+-driven multidrug efflux pump